MSKSGWRECPFVVGSRYRVRCDFTALRDRFTAGEILIYRSEGWSRYDGYTGYFFQQPDSTGFRAWDIDDDGDIGIWQDFFEPINDESV